VAGFIRTLLWIPPCGRAAPCYRSAVSANDARLWTGIDERGALPESSREPPETTTNPAGSSDWLLAVCLGSLR
jgi:hypothetical protein